MFLVNGLILTLCSPDAEEPASTAWCARTSGSTDSNGRMTNR